MGLNDQRVNRARDLLLDALQYVTIQFTRHVLAGLDGCLA